MRRGFLLSSASPKPNSNPQAPPSTPNPRPSSSTPNSSPSSSTPNPLPPSSTPNTIASSSTPNPSPPSPTPNPSDGGCEDRLSSLPDPILHEILCRLPTDELVRTSVLARCWRRLWTSSLDLHFTRNFTRSFELNDYPFIIDRRCLPLEDYLSIVDRCLSQCTDTRRFSSISFPIGKSDAFSLTADRWIRFAAERSVEHLAFAPTCYVESVLEMPPSLFDCRTLSSLNLDRCSFSTVPAGSFPSLTKVAFTNVTIDDAALGALIGDCSRIESLSLRAVHKITRLVVRSPVMRHLMVNRCIGLKQIEIVEAPELRRLIYIGDLLKFKKLDRGIVPKLEEAVLMSSAKDPFGDQGMWERLVRAFAHVRVLSVNSWLLQLGILKYTLGGRFGFGEQPDVFHNLKELHLWPVFDDKQYSLWGWDPDKISAYSLYDLFSILRAFPSMEQLCVRSTYTMEYDDVFEDDEWYGEDFILQEFEEVGYKLPCLKMVTIIEFSGRKEEKKLLEFLAGKAPVLESFFLHYIPDEVWTDKILREVNAFRKASPHIEVSLVEFDDYNICSKHDGIFLRYHESK